jgi:hypothetical protein
LRFKRVVQPLAPAPVEPVVPALRAEKPRLEKTRARKA